MNQNMCFSRFDNSNSNEVFLAIESKQGLNFSQSLQNVLGRYKEVLQQEGLDDNSEIFLRFHLSDITNQLPILKGTIQDIEDRSFVSIIGQPPARGGKIALEAYHIDAPGRLRKLERTPNTLTVRHGNYCSQWIKGQLARPESSYQQTHQIFAHLASEISKYDATILDNIIRTWIYVRDIDNNYQGMVDARRELFDIIGLTKGTHYIASTGIEGLGCNVSDLVSMDSLSITGLAPEQITFINAPEYLCPTYDYNVTFERATRVTYGDRSHYYISGTASIDREGNILHPENVIKQAERTLVNIEALLQKYGAEMNDLKILVVYLRDPSEAGIVNNFLQNALPKNIPWIMVRGAVCRPQWLIEIEGIAISKFADYRYESFCHSM
ncbi:Enamine deaminase RidA, house cleaning of reactive enamine intermediates, YjgF/YER057c/UK114 family [Maridesulfovibrio ferrireducens]|uniref:Enamine deaminase RidA, house cleaning of reactive enamine intermediates, YjgF/YER057c/UK114 family n=1 Tax=Maridesulfovibrio ferrireducens TaxID=246191 RepID=A0A1G9ESV8_9BACT|nr:Rid family hydrolase [Maridesulfovibrio ferrireducens]SDK79252.1 Enamine deaminase RidA, house cleaning of reactive enamine intermediates, YjgF/YER057c/UK114 family [Maridesulfovibrio ferrireducens]